MTWKPHVNKVACKIARTIGTINRLKRFLPKSVLQILYNSLVLPHLNYGILTWGATTKHLQKLQKWAIRTITNSKYNAHTEPLFKKLDLLKICDLYKVKAIKLYFKYQNNFLLSYFNGIFTFMQPPQEYQTRNRNTVYPR